MTDRLDTGSAPKRSPTPRRSARIVLKADVGLRRSAHQNYRVSVYDISPQGCRLEFVERPQLDERVWVKFEGLEAMEALVCWVDGFVAGVEFERPIYPAVFELLVARLK